MTNRLCKILPVFLLLCTSLFAQVETEKWGALEYEEPTHSEPGSGFSLLGSMQGVYSFFISDLDGDNCPFYPNCSTFFVQASAQEGLVKGILMFGDRFTRDSNLFKDPHQYHIHNSGLLYDPVNNYSNNLSEIQFVPYDNKTTNSNHYKCNCRLYNSAE